MGRIEDLTVEDWRGLALDFALFMLCLWITLIVYVYAHECAHAVAAHVYGGYAVNLHIDPVQLTGFVTLITPPESYWLVHAAGILITLFMTIVAYSIREDYFVYGGCLITMSNLVAVPRCDTLHLFGVDPYFTTALITVTAFTVTFLASRRAVEWWEKAFDPVKNSGAFPFMAAGLVVASLGILNYLLLL